MRMLSASAGVGPAGGLRGPVHQPTRGTRAREAGAFARELSAEQLKWSRHARQRLADRGLDLSPGQLQRIARGVERAAAKGARDSLVLLDQLALIVNIPNRTVLTALDSRRLQQGVVTNIDSTVFA